MKLGKKLLFVIGLFKKVAIADNIALYSTPLFDAAHQGASISFFEVGLAKVESE